MTLDPDAIVDRRRMRRKLTFWRVGAVVIAIAAIVRSRLATIPAARWMEPRRLYRAHQGHRPDPRQ